MRDGCMYTAGLHMLLLSIERQVATMRSETYENESHLIQICMTIACLWISSYLIVAKLKDQIFTNFLAAFIFLIIYGVSVLIMLHVRRTNFTKWKKHRGTLQFSQSYQVRENVTSARYLYSCFIVFSIQTIIAWICLILYLVFRRVYGVPALEKIFGFVFDIMLASQTTVIPLTIILNNMRLRSHFKEISVKYCPLIGTGILQSSQNITDLEGRNVKVGSNFETITYFDQLRKAWS